MNVLSLFDGMSCGQIALKRTGVKVNNYFASEIDKYAIKITQKNYPDTIQLGDISDIKPFLRLPKIDLLLGGSPCQGFSFAGKQLAFNDPRSKLFFEYVRILKQLKIINPDIKFLLENVRMKKQYLDIISEYLGFEPICINSSLLSAQHRIRYYWTNIDGVEQPEDKKIFLKDVVFNDAIFQFPHGCSKGGVRIFDKIPTRTKQFHNNYFPVCLHLSHACFGEGHRAYTLKSPTVRPASGGHIPSLLLSKKAIAYMNRKVKGGRNHWEFKHHSDIRNEKSSAVVANFFKGVPYNVLKTYNLIRKFHPIECEKLQTLPVNYTEGVSNTQRYKMIGN